MACRSVPCDKQPTADPTFHSLRQVLLALKISAELPPDENLLVLLDLAASSLDVAAFLHAVSEQPVIAVAASIEPPERIARLVAAAGLDWSKFLHLLPRVRQVRRFLHAFREAKT